jgi:aspartate racemase
MPDGSYPPLIINSVDLKREMDLISTNDMAGATKYLLDEIKRLARARADFGLIASNTPHIVFDEIARDSPIPLISIVKCACAAARARKLKRLGLFGTRFTMQGKFYPEVFTEAGIELVAPDANDQAYIHDKYVNELVPGTFLPETREKLLAIIDRLRARMNIDGVILAGTELPFTPKPRSLRCSRSNNRPRFRRARELTQLLLRRHLSVTIVP